MPAGDDLLAGGAAHPRTALILSATHGGQKSLQRSSTGCSLAAAASPMLAGSLLAISGFGWPLLIAGALKIVYDILLLTMFRKVRPPEERQDRQ